MSETDRRRLVARLRHLPGLSALVPGHDRRRHRRSRRHHRAAAAHRLARRRRDLAVALLQVADGRHGLRRLGLLRRRSDVRHDRGFRPAGRRGAPARPQGHHRPGAVAHVRPAPLVQGKPRRAATTPRPTGTSGPTPSRTAPRRTTGCRCSAARPGNGTATRKQYYMHNFLASQPDLNFHNREVQDALLETVRFWLERGVDGFRLDTVNYYFHDRKLRNNPPLPRGGRPGMSRRQSLRLPAPSVRQDAAGEPRLPEALPRAARRAMASRMAVGEVGDEERSLATVAAYTSGGDKLHMCYTFDLLGPRILGRPCPQMRERLRGRGRRRLDLLGLLQPRRDAPCLALDRAGRRSRRGRQIRDRAAGLAARLDLPLPGRGTRAARRPSSPSRICAIPTASASGRPSRAATAAARRWSGRAASRMPASPPASRGCRCPRRIAAAPSTCRRASRHRCWRTIAGRWRSADSIRRWSPARSSSSRPRGDVLAFVRSGEGEQLLCVFNFASEAAQWAIPTGLGALEIVESRGARLDASTLALDGLSSCFARIGLP